jgi:hypothetical protein
MYFPEFPNSPNNPLLETPAVIWRNSQPLPEDSPVVAEQRQWIAVHLGRTVRCAIETGLALSAWGLATAAEAKPLAGGFLFTSIVLAAFTTYNYGKAALANRDLAANPQAVTWSVEYPSDSYYSD